MINKGVQFGEFHSYNDFDLLIAKDGIQIPPAQPKTNFVDIPGGDGSLDLTEAHGEIKYNDRDCRFTFVMNPSGGLTDADFEAKKTQVSNALNGVYCRITPDKDPDYYYLGRCAVSEYLSDKRIRQIVVTAKVFPYKFKKYVTTVEKTLSATPATLILTNGRKYVVPGIVCTADNTTVQFENTSKTMNAGTHTFLDFQLKQGDNTFTVSGSGKITFIYQEADL